MRKHVLVVLGLIAVFSAGKAAEMTWPDIAAHIWWKIAFATSAIMVIVSYPKIVFAPVTIPLNWIRKRFHSIPEADQQIKPVKRIYTARTVDEMFAAIKNMTDIEVERFAQPHIGKWIRVQSVIRNMQSDDNFFYVMLGKSLDPMPYLRFTREKWGSSLETMTQGDRLATEGKITGLDHLTLDMDSCAIVGLREKDDVLRPIKR